jgi:hypothetical protein
MGSTKLQQDLKQAHITASVGNFIYFKLIFSKFFKSDLRFKDAQYCIPKPTSQSKYKHHLS